MTNRMKRVIEMARGRGAAADGPCLVCRRPVARRDAAIRTHAGIAHARCATYRARRSR